jgi:hypothetical protein
MLSNKKAVLGAGHWSLVSGCWLLGTGLWPLASCHWVLAIGRWFLVTGSLAMGLWSLDWNTTYEIMLLKYEAQLSGIF